MFKAQMVRKNVELELQALVLLQHQLGIIKGKDKGEKQRHHQHRHHNENDDEIMKMVMKRSKDEYEALMQSKKKNADFEDDASLPIQRAEDLETAKKLVKSDELVNNLKNELDQQDKINHQIVKEELADSTPKTSSRVERPASAASKPKAKPQRVDDDDDDDDVVGSSASRLG